MIADPDSLLVVADPATAAMLAEVRAWRSGEIDACIVKAASAQHGWSVLASGERATLLLRWYDLMLGAKQELAATITAESGKPLAEAESEVSYAASFIRWFAEEGRRAYGETIPAHAPGRRVMTWRRPVGVCAAITPWNFPLAMITRKAAPALAAGCAMLVKPAEATPLSALALERLAHEAGIPSALFQVLPTNDPEGVGRVLCDSPIVRKLSFTGSTRVGKILLGQCAPTVKRTSMELGGNAPFLVFADADLDAAVDGLMLAKFRNAGQTCVAANRLLVADAVHDAFVERLARRIEQLVVGDGSDPATTIGPLINERAVVRVSALVDEAVTAGAKLRIGGKPHPAGPGFFTPTLLTACTMAMKVAQEEIFGPVVPVIRFGDDAEAMALANATPAGLAAYAYTRDVGRCWRLLDGLAFGMVALNEGLLSTEIAPFGGIKESGFGREGGRQGLEEYLDVQYALMGGL